MAQLTVRPKVAHQAFPIKLPVLPKVLQHPEKHPVQHPFPHKIKLPHQHQRPVQQPARPHGAHPFRRTWAADLAGLEDEDLAGLGSTLKKIGKKIGNAFKPKNLLKTAAVAAVAYGGYKLATSDTGKSVFSSIGSGLSKVGSAAVKVVGATADALPQLANSYVAYQSAAVNQPTAQDAGLVYGDGYGVSIPDSGATVTDTTQSSLPGWVIPAALGAGLLLLVTRR